jgi:hypothetical protein
MFIKVDRSDLSSPFIALDKIIMVESPRKGITTLTLEGNLKVQIDEPAESFLLRVEALRKGSE